MIYTVEVARSVFGASGFGSVAITACTTRRKMKRPAACELCWTNIAVATAMAGSVPLTESTPRRSASARM